MHENVLKSAIYISYAWNKESDDIAEAIEKEFGKKGVRVIRDKNGLQYKERLKDFMRAIGRGKYVILIISNRYLKSENCMFELLQIFKNQDFYERIFPVVLEDVKISRATDRVELVKYWENETDNLDRKIRELKKLSNIQGVTDDLNLYTEIRNNIAKLTNILKDIYYLNTERHISSNFKQLYELIQAKIEKDTKIDKRVPSTEEQDDSGEDQNGKQVKNDDGSSESNRNTKKVLIGFTGILALVLIMQVLSQSKLLNKEQETSNPAIDTLVGIESTTLPDEKDALEIERIDHKPPLISNIKYDVILVVPSFMAKEDVYVDNELAQVVSRSLTTITVRLGKKSGSHHFEMTKGPQKCVADKLIEQDSMQFPMLCD